MTEELTEQVARIYERAQNETLALIQSRPAEKIVIPVREWMSATQLAEYWQLYNDKNEPTTGLILKWSKRPPDKFPLPHAYMGDLLRFKRDEVDLWARAKWWMEFTLRSHYVFESIPRARTRAQAERAENKVRESIYDGKLRAWHA